MYTSIEHNELLGKKQFDIKERPMPGYTYIYIYSHDDIYIYVGQTIQSVFARYKNHLSDNSGAHYANQIHCFQIKSEYANYAEGYLASRLSGISQGNIPNYSYSIDTTPKHVQSVVQKIGRVLRNYKNTDDCLRVGKLPIVTFEITGDGNYATLKFFSKIVKERSVLWDNFSPAKNYMSYFDLYLKELTYDHQIQVYLITAPRAEHRPICFFVVDSAKGVKEVAKIKSNFPIYCVIDDWYYQKYQKFIDSAFEKSGVGILLDNENEVVEQKKPSKLYGRKNMKCTELVCFFGETTYRAQKTPYGYYRCA